MQLVLIALLIFAGYVLTIFRHQGNAITTLRNNVKEYLMPMFKTTRITGSTNIIDYHRLLNIIFISFDINYNFSFHNKCNVVNEIYHSPISFRYYDNILSLINYLFKNMLHISYRFYMEYGRKLKKKVAWEFLRTPKKVTKNDVYNI